MAELAVAVNGYRKMNDPALLITKRLADAYNRKDWGAFAELLDPNAIYESPGLESDRVECYEGIKSILEYMLDWSTAIPDDKATFISSELIDENTVFCEVVWSGTRTGTPFLVRGTSAPPNGSEFFNRGSTTYKVRNGKIARITDQFDVRAFLSGFGLASC